ncbi:hypothetical protein GQ44DRAFT_709819 [Phaeosphaeriaceae sp. PMI808]|nr:hypothetical protein GQ44DRAFT_709819 [Phaeosphaeriaceae sp. PMI808]
MSQVEAYYPATMPVSQTAHSIDTTDIINGHDLHLPNSQESIMSAVSSTFSPPKLPSSSSNVSTSTTTETDITYPSATNAIPTQSKATYAPIPTSPVHARGSSVRPTAAIDIVAANASQLGDTAASPRPLESPVTQGFKRSADGSVKGVEPAGKNPRAPSAAAHKRNKSMDTHSGGRIGELSAQLKTRLSYAMVKVQNGWEKQSLEELEEVHSQRGSPNSAPARTDRLVFDSPSTPDRRRRPSGVSDNSDPMLISPASEPLRSHANISSR